MLPEGFQSIQLSIGRAKSYTWIFDGRRQLVVPFVLSSFKGQLYSENISLNKFIVHSSEILQVHFQTTTIKQIVQYESQMFFFVVSQVLMLCLHDVVVYEVCNTIWQKCTYFNLKILLFLKTSSHYVSFGEL